MAQGLRAYLRGQALVALLVGALAALGLWIAGVRSPLALGGIVGLFNLIPYFGPLLGGVPVVLTALAQSPWTVLFSLIVLFLVQQLDGLLHQPRVMKGRNRPLPYSGAPGPHPGRQRLGRCRYALGPPRHVNC